MVELWQGLSDTNQTILIVSAVIAVLGGGFSVLYAYTKGSDFKGFGDWLRSWFK